MFDKRMRHPMLDLPRQKRSIYLSKKLLCSFFIYVRPKQGYILWIHLSEDNDQSIHLSLLLVNLRRNIETLSTVMQ